MKRQRLFILVLLLLFVAVSCGSNVSIQGKWKHDGNNTIYDFQKDGVLVMTFPSGKSFEGSYELDKETSQVVITVTIDGDVISQASSYTIEGNTMTMTSPDTGSSITFTRQ